jgi:hypothetical protein
MRGHLRLLGRAVIALLFLWAAYAKTVMPATGPTLYQHWIAMYPVLRYLVPAGEGMLGIWLLLGLRLRWSALLSILLVSAFSGLLIMELTKDHPLPCGCMGAAAAAYEPKAIYTDLILSLLRNVIMISIACYLYLISGVQVTADARSGVHPPESAPAA